jgi:hypothetical protein
MTASAANPLAPSQRQDDAAREYRPAALCVHPQAYSPAEGLRRNPPGARSAPRTRNDSPRPPHGRQSRSSPNFPVLEPTDDRALLYRHRRLTRSSDCAPGRSRTETLSVMPWPSNRCRSDVQSGCWRRAESANPGSRRKCINHPRSSSARTNAATRLETPTRKIMNFAEKSTAICRESGMGRAGPVSASSWPSRTR